MTSPAAGAHPEGTRGTRALAGFASALALATSQAEAVDALARSVVEATAARACAVLALEHPALAGEEVPSVRTVGTANLPEDWARRVEGLWRDGAALPPRQALATGRIAMAQEPPEAIRAYAEEAGVQAIASVPMRFQGRIVGLLNCIYPGPAEIDEAELAFLETVAPLAAVVVENTRLLEQVREQVRAQERQHLARELHDSVTQAFYGIGLGARTALKLLEQEPDRAVEPLQYVLALAESGLAEMRALLFELRPEDLQRNGLVAALRSRARALSAHHLLEVDLHLPEEPDLPADVRHGLFRIASEAAQNVVKHAAASRVGFSLQVAGDEAVLEIEDDGQGFSHVEGEPGHLGLASMRERAEALGGTLQVASSLGAGTRVRARIPLR